MNLSNKDRYIKVVRKGKGEKVVKEAKKVNRKAGKGKEAVREENKNKTMMVNSNQRKNVWNQKRTHLASEEARESEHVEPIVDASPKFIV